MQTSLKNYIDYTNQLGVGAYSNVYAMIQHPQYSAYVAKVFKHDKYINQTTRKHIDRQIQCLKQLKQIPQVLKLIKVQDQVIFLQKCDTSLEYLLKNHKLSEYDILLLLKSLLKCLSSMNAKKYLHRDLKPANILIKDLKNPIIRLSDFNSSKKFTDQTQTQKNPEKHTIGIGTLLYSAPEVRQSANYNLKCDVYSFGLVLHELCFGKLPFQITLMGVLKFEQNLRINKLKINQTNNIQPYFIELIQSTIAYNPYERPNFQELWMRFQHKFLQLQQKLKKKCQNKLFRVPIKIKSMGNSTDKIQWSAKTAFSTNYATLLKLINIIKNQVMKYYDLLEIQKKIESFRNQYEWYELQLVLRIILINLFTEKVSDQLKKISDNKIQNQNINNLNLSVEELDDYQKLVECYETEFNNEKKNLIKTIKKIQQDLINNKEKQYQHLINQTSNNYDLYKQLLKEFKNKYYNTDKQKYAFYFLYLLLALQIQDSNQRTTIESMNRLKIQSKNILTQQRILECQQKCKIYCI